MCGVVGLAGDLFGKEELTMKKLLLLDSLRGMDSTGMAAVRRGGLRVEVARRASHCFNLFDTKSFIDALNGSGSMAFIGHNRSATVGKITDVNAHPFQIGHITGVHNGTLETKDKDLLEDLVGEKFNTDSEALFAAIDKLGVKEVIPKLTKGRDSYKGAWSLVWWDSKDKTLNFLRNEHRPLWYCYSEDFKQIFWASEFWMLDAVLQKTGSYTLFKKESTKEPSKKWTFFQTDPDIHYIVDVEKLAKGSKERPKFPAAKLAGKEPVEAGTYYPFVGENSRMSGNSSGTNTGTGTHTQPLKKSTKTTLHKNSSSGEACAITLQGDIGNPYGGYFTKMGFSFLGNTRILGSENPQCSWCHEEIPFGQPGVTIFTRDNLIHCAKCSGNDLVSPLSDFAPATRVYVPRHQFNELR